jgi:ParB family chromosome partitioning protein
VDDAPLRDRRGLGRGLSSLLGDADLIGAGADSSGSLAQIRLGAIVPNPDQPRGAIDPEALEALAASIRASGILQPVVVAPADSEGRHQLIAGERRWRAARLAGLERVPAVIRAVDARERLELALVENIVREDLSPIDVAMACACLIEDFGQSHGMLAGRLGRSRPAISNLVRLLELPDAVQEMIAAGSLSEGHGRAILMADGPARRTRVAEQVAEQGLSVRATEDLARREAGTPRSQPRRSGDASHLGDAALEAFGAAFDAPVRVRTRSTGQVVVELRFADDAALGAALERLSGGSAAG